MENAVTQLAINKAIDEKKEQHANVDFKMVSFALGGKDYAIDILKVKEIAKADRFTYVPNTAPFVVGVYNLRGEIIPILDLRIFFNLEVIERSDDELENMIIIAFGEQKYGVVVDRIEKVIGIQRNTIQPPHPLFGDINIKYIYGIIENDAHMYILLDVERIFGIDSSNDFEKNEIKVVRKEADSQQSSAPQQSTGDVNIKTPVSVPPPKIAEVLSQMPQQQPNLANKQLATQAVAPIIKVVPPSEPKIAKVVETAKTIVPENVSSDLPNAEYFDLKFVVESLKTLQNFYMSSLNQTWLLKRFYQWKNERGANNVQLTDNSVAKAFMSPFYSQCALKFWNKKYADAIYALLPENSAKQIQVWNPGCGSGYEAYSLACLLKKRYPDARIKIYAQDNDLILISSAPLLLIPEADAEGWYKPYITKTVSGDLLFSPEIRDSILFEYHDCTNMNITPDVDIIFSREFLSFIPQKALENVLGDFHEKIKENGIIIVGDNEVLEDHTKWLEKVQGSVVVYNKQ